MYAYLISLVPLHLFVLAFTERGVLNFEAMIIGLFVSSSLSIFIYFFPRWDVRQLCLYLFHLIEMAVLSDTMAFLLVIDFYLSTILT